MITGRTGRKVLSDDRQRVGNEREVGRVDPVECGVQPFVALQQQRCAALGDPDRRTSTVPRVLDAFGDALALEAVDERGQRAACQAEIAGQIGLPGAAVDLEVGQRLALGRAQAKRLGQYLSVVLTSKNEPPQVADSSILRGALGDHVHLLSQGQPRTA